MSFIDSVIEWVSPSWASERVATRAAIREQKRIEAKRAERWSRLDRANSEKLVGFDRTKPTPRSHRVESHGSPADWNLELGFDRRDAVDQARQLEQNNSLAQSFLDRYVEHVVGDGFTLKCKTEDEGWNRAAEQYFNEWCEKGADSRGILSFNEMLGIVCRSEARDGDVAGRYEHDGSIRLMESDEIASSLGGYSRPSDVDGVELDSKGRIVAYHCFEYDPSVLWPDRRRAIPRLVRVPAEEVLFLARRQRAGQTRGMSIFNGIAWMLEELDDTVEAKAAQEYMASCFGLVLKKKTAMGGQSQGADPEVRFGPGRTIRVDPGEDVTVLNPPAAGGFEPLSVSMMRFVAARFGINLEAVYYNFDKANYSNLRAGSLESTRSIRIKQRNLVRRFFSPVVGWKLAQAIKTGELPPRRDAWKHVVGVPGSQWVDPEVELRAAMGSVDGCMDTRRSILARRGLDFDQVVKELADEEQKIRKAGITMTRSTLTRDALPTTKTISEPKTPDAAKNKGKGAQLVKTSKSAKRTKPPRTTPAAVPSTSLTS